MVPINSDGRMEKIAEYNAVHQSIRFMGRPVMWKGKFIHDIYLYYLPCYVHFLDS